LGLGKQKRPSVIPVKTGIQEIIEKILDSRLRGNDKKIKIIYMQIYCSKQLRKKLQRQGAQGLRSEAYLSVGRKDEGRSATQYVGFLRSC
jgi:hypothetical protein